MALSRGFWINDAYLSLESDILAVGYKHHLDRVDTDIDEITQFFAYRARAKNDEKQGWADDWGRNFALSVKSHGKMIIVEAERNWGKLVEVGRMECSGASLIIEIPKQSPKNVSIGAATLPAKRMWMPDGYADPDHLWNRQEVRSETIVRPIADWMKS